MPASPKWLAPAPCLPWQQGCLGQQWERGPWLSRPWNSFTRSGFVLDLFDIFESLGSAPVCNKQTFGAVASFLQSLSSWLGRGIRPSMGPLSSLLVVGHLSALQSPLQEDQRPLPPWVPERGQRPSCLQGMMLNVAMVRGSLFCLPWPTAPVGPGTVHTVWLLPRSRKPAGPGRPAAHLWAGLQGPWV